MYESKNLKIIQTIAHICKILSKIASVCCVVGAIICMVAIAPVYFGTEGVFKLGGVTIYSLLGGQDISKGTMYAAAFVGLIICVGEGILAKQTYRYLKNELVAGTPFTHAGAKELLRLGIFGFVVPIVTGVVANIVYNLINRFMPAVADLHIDNYLTSCGFGLACLLLALICGYGAELAERAERAESAESAEIAENR